MEQFIRDDGFIQSHATVIENADNGLFLLELPAKISAELLIGRRKFRKRQIFYVTLVVGNDAFSQPLPQTALEQAVGKFFAPQGTIFDAGLGQRTIKIEHANQPRPGAAPVGEGQNWATMREQARQYVMAVLPHPFRHNQWCIWIKLPEDSHPHFL